MKICPECKDVLIYCKCMEEYLEKNEPMLTDSQILEELKKYMSTVNGGHIRMDKWEELYNMITSNKSIDECENEYEINESKRISLFMKKNPPPEKDFGPPSVMATLLIRWFALGKQLDYALKIGRIKEVDKFIRNLNEDEWCC